MLMGEMVRIVKLGDYKFSIVTKAQETNPTLTSSPQNAPPKIDLKSMQSHL